MITASHNPEPDNGMKLADSHGGMLDADWEKHAVSLANAPGSRDALAMIDALSRRAKGLHPQPGGGMPPMVVHVGRDTRSHSPALCALVVSAARAMGATVVDHGEVSTPMLHHFVMHANGHRLPCLIPQRINESGYYEVMAMSYAALLRTKGAGSNGRRRTTRRLVIDGACGIGAPKVDRFRRIFARLGSEGGTSGLPLLQTVNFPGEGPLNENCGGEYVQKQRLPPRVYSAAPPGGLDKSYMCSFDGDADRIVFHYEDTSASNKFNLLDGDKIAVLVSSFVQDEINHVDPTGTSVRCGVVQTAYANGSSTAYLRNVVRTDVVVAKTGVKFVHAAAHDSFDVGVYFEANGHGTVLFGPRFYDFVSEAEARLRGSPRGDRAGLALRRLRLLPALVNQSVGDAMSDMLLVDAILYLRDWDLRDWAGLYDDMPSRQAKVRVRDRGAITTNDTETEATSPAALRDALRAAMDAAASSGSGQSAARPRCFVRPSGTEDAVRVYAEAGTQRGADALASEAAALVHSLAGGVGPAPVPMVASGM